MHSRTIKVMLCLAALCGNPVKAEIITATFTGAVSLVINPTGMFSRVAPGNSWKSVYVFNSNEGYTYRNAHVAELSGGSYDGVPSPLVSATLSINGITVAVGGSYESILGVTPAQSAYDATADVTEEEYLENFIVAPPYSFHSIGGPFSYTDSVDTVVDDADTAFGLLFDEYTAGSAEYISASLTNLTVSSGPAPIIPEAATWVMTLLGFAPLGFAWYRQAGGGAAIAA